MRRMKEQKKQKEELLRWMETLVGVVHRNQGERVYHGGGIQLCHILCHILWQDSTIRFSILRERQKIIKNMIKVIKDHF